MIEKEDQPAKVIWSDKTASREILLHGEGAIGFYIAGATYWKSIDQWVETVRENDRYAVELMNARTRIHQLEAAIADKLIRENKLNES